MATRTSSFRVLSLALALSAPALLVGCDDDEPETPAQTEPEQTAEAETQTEDEDEGDEQAPTQTAAVPDELPEGLLVTYSPFSERDGQWIVPAPARLELITRSGGEWNVEAITDEESNVFHKALPYTLWGQEGIITIGGMRASVKFWTKNDGEWTGRLIWRERFGGQIDRMRDVEVFEYQGVQHLAIATHDQGYLALLSPANVEPPADAPDPGPDGDFLLPGFTLRKSARRANMFVHEIEVGDLNGDGTPEIYATPSEPNHMGGGAQHGEVVRFLPTGEGELETTVVADLGERHAKEILVADVDGDGRDELYVSVEGIRPEGGGDITESVEVRRFDADTAADARVVIATIEGDELMRFLTAGDVDGDGKDEIVAASFTKGLWLLTPGSDPRGEWGVENFDRQSGGFEHTSYLADLDGNGFDELYVSSDNHGELRRYAWVDGRARRSVVSSREVPSSMITWNIVRAPRALIAE